MIIFDWILNGNNMLMFIFIYIWAAIGTLFFEDVDPKHWADIGVAMLTLVQVATYDDWAMILGLLIDEHPFAWLYFVSFIIVNAVVLLNMVIGVIVDVMTTETKDNFITEEER